LFALIPIVFLPYKKFRQVALKGVERGDQGINNS
jgi:hypothetical protein